MLCCLRDSCVLLTHGSSGLLEAYDDDDVQCEDFVRMEMAEKEYTPPVETEQKKSEGPSAGGDSKETPISGKADTVDSEKPEGSAAGGDFKKPPASGKSVDSKKSEGSAAGRAVKMIPPSRKSGTVDPKSSGGIPVSGDFEEGGPYVMSAGITFQPVGTAALRERVDYSPVVFKSPVGLSPRLDYSLYTPAGKSGLGLFKQPLLPNKSLADFSPLHGKPGSAGAFQKPMDTSPGQGTPIFPSPGRWGRAVAALNPLGSPWQGSYKLSTPGTSGSATAAITASASLQDSTKLPTEGESDLGTPMGATGTSSQGEDAQPSTSAGNSGPVKITAGGLEAASTPTASGSAGGVTTYAKRKAYANLSRASSSEKPPLKSMKQENTTRTITPP